MTKLVNRWFAFHLKAVGKRPASVVEARTTVCRGQDGPPGRLYRAPSWARLQQGSYITPPLGASPQMLETPSNDPNSDLVLPIDSIRPGGPGNTVEPDGSCRTGPVRHSSDNAAFVHALPPGGMTMLGLPEVTITGVDASDDNMYLAARLWDVAEGMDPETEEDDTQTLVTRGVYRLTTDGSIPEVSFKLFGNAYTFEPGHSLKIELSADDSPSFRRYGDPDNPDPASIAIDAVEVELPLADCTRLVADPCVP